MKLQTERLILRPPVVSDAEDYAAIHNSTFVLRFNAMQPAAPERMAQKFANPEETENTVLLEEKSTGHLLGAVFVEEDSLRWGVASRELSYFIREEAARQGFMKEALRAVIACLFESEDLLCVSARAFAPNGASRALLRSLGFRENGIIPLCVKGYGGTVYDDVLHSLLRDEFLSRSYNENV